MPKAVRELIGVLDTTRETQKREKKKNNSCRKVILCSLSNIPLMNVNCGTWNAKVEKTFKLTRMSKNIITTVCQDDRILIANIMISGGVWMNSTSEILKFTTILVGPFD